ncbi:hypothetical protein [Streptomyces hygroscopicus]
MAAELWERLGWERLGWERLGWERLGAGVSPGHGSGWVRKLLRQGSC